MDTVNVSLAANPKAELLVSGGDQIESANNETQWDAFLAPNKLRQYPWAATIGNHDVGGKAYEQHFWTPNTDRSTPYYNGDAATRSGGDYYYTYKGVLFIDLNSNAYAARSDAAHISYVTDVVKKHGADAKYTVLVYHHSIYSLGQSRERQRQPAASSGLPDRLLEPRCRPRPAGSRPQLLPQLRDQERSEVEQEREAGCRRGGAGSGWRHLRDGELRVGLEVLQHHRSGHDQGPELRS
ncbi:metallophosphoesterase family protein [Streptosporangium lutulentum]